MISYDTGFLFVQYRTCIGSIVEDGSHYYSSLAIYFGLGSYTEPVQVLLSIELIAIKKHYSTLEVFNNSLLFTVPTGLIVIYLLIVESIKHSILLEYCR